ncbi:TPA: hypothetical protein QHO52_003187 [Klebsiella pneumoniae subsp. pneumoniae]|nr:hypothetical protein [Klebsiella pneumoniae subsp. pneumoniae]HDT4786573.1 hypothetical protein [Klebsiella pneumoniae]
MDKSALKKLLMTCRQQAEQFRRLSRLAHHSPAEELTLSWHSLLTAATSLESLCCSCDKLLAELGQLDRSETQLIVERDAAQETLSAIYEAVTGAAPEWSNVFTYMDAIDEVNELMAAGEKSSHVH